jgi:hypothetical protein
MIQDIITLAIAVSLVGLCAWRVVWRWPSLASCIVISGVAGEALKVAGAVLGRLLAAA